MLADAAALLGLGHAGRRRTHVGLRQIEREGAALAGRALQLDFAAEQVGQFAADGQAQTGAAELAAGARIGLLEGLEDDALLFRRNADAGIGDLEGDHRAGAARESGDRCSSRSVARETVSRTLPCSVNLKALESRFLSTCCRRLESVTRLRPMCGSAVTSNDQPAVFRLVAERPRDGFEQRCRRRPLPLRPKPCPIRSWRDRECR